MTAAGSAASSGLSASSSLESLAHLDLVFSRMRSELTESSRFREWYIGSSRTGVNLYSDSEKFSHIFLPELFKI